MTAIPKTDIIGMLRHLVNALKLFAKQQQVNLMFQPDRKQLFIENDTEKIVADIITLVYQVVSYSPPNETLLLKTLLVDEVEQAFLKITLQNTGVNLSRVGEISNKCKQHVEKYGCENGTVYELKLPLHHLEHRDKTNPELNFVNLKFPPHFYNEIRKRLRPTTTRAGNLMAALSEKHPKNAIFLQKVNACISANIDEDNFDANRLSDMMNMSRTQLYRKLKLLIKQSPGHYIKCIRLQKAKELLETTDMQVGEVAYKTGFHTQSHFTKAFVQQYGIKPSLLRRKHENVTKE